MKSSAKLALASVALIASVAFTGCSSSNSHDLYTKHNEGFNALGIVKWSPSGYNEIENSSDVFYSDELVNRKNISGDNLSLFWGALVYADY